MLFNSYEYILVFLPLTFFIYFLLRRNNFHETAKCILVFASLFFYSWWKAAYLPLILGSIFFNYIIGNLISKRGIKNYRQWLLIVGIVSNLSLLGYFKYTNFGLETFSFLFKNNIAHLNIVLPLAISFFTFQQITYLVDSYNFETEEYSLLNYSLFVCFFPQLIAGPIVHHKQMMPQFASLQKISIEYKNVATGIYIFAIGLFKKVLIADTFAIWAVKGFDTADTLTFIEAWVTSLSYTFQLYFDFSGYTDMAIGAALLFNIKLPINFNSPYKATNIQEFWKRWHITLSTFFRDYIYIPLGGNKKGDIRVYANLMVTFLLVGLWHGAGWTFIFWGFLHGVALVIHRLWTKYGFSLNGIVAGFITFNFVNMTWIFFRATEWKDATKILYAMFFGSFVIPKSLEYRLTSLRQYGIEFGDWMPNIGGNKYTVLMIVVCLLGVFILKNSMQLIDTYKPTYIYQVFTAVILSISILNLSKVSEFLYFNF